jgi:AraC family transcriptional regulator
MVYAQPPKNFTHGDIVRWRRVGGLVLAEVQYTGGQRVHQHSHPHARFVLILGGSLTEIRSGDTRTYRASALLFRRPAEPHAYVASPSGATCLVVDVDPAWYARAQTHAPVLEQSAAFRGGFVVHLAHRLHGEFRLRDEVSRLAIESISLGILAEASRRVTRADHSQAPAWLRQARAFVEAHFTESVPLADVAERVGVHPVHLARTFRRVHDMTFAGYVRHLRIEFARRELASAIRVTSRGSSSVTPA